MPGEFQAERGGLPMNAMGTADAQRVFMLKDAFFERGQHLDPCTVAHIGKDAQILTQLRRVHHECGAIDTVKVEPGKSPGITGTCFHQNSTGPSSSSTVQGSPCWFSISMNGSGSICSMLNTPSPSQMPCTTMAAPIIAGTPVV